jgi:class 3 adenylate cyclase
MEPSEELRRVITRFFQSARDGDTQAVSNRFSRQPGFHRFGSDPDEDWSDGEYAALVMMEQIRETGGFPWRQIGEVNAQVEGSVGWADVRAEFDSQAGVVPLRLTFVLHLEHDEWKIVQAHSSVPASNAQFGLELTTSVDQIAELVRASQPDLSATSAPDGTITIMFTDIEGSTRLNEFMGDRRWLDVLRSHNDVIKAKTLQHEGTVVKSQGDGFMLAFASARRALQCAEEIQDAIAERFNDPGSLVRIRVGLHVGEALREADDFFGNAVTYAARIAAHARGGEIVVSSLVHDLLAQTGEFKFGEMRVVDLKGINGSQRIYSLAD